MQGSAEIWFIINAFSGHKKAKNRADLLVEINKYPNSKIIYTEYAGHATEIAKNAVNQGIERVIAVGGDGTINEVGSALRGTKTVMGIVPMGSGNGLARHLNLPLKTVQSVHRALNGKAFEIDTCTINEIPFFCTAGVGFDAFVAENFSKKSKRGFITYIITSIQSFFVFKPPLLDIKFEQSNQIYVPFAVTFANASQYGNNATVAPESEINDGLIDMVILKQFSIFASLLIAWRLFNGSFSKSKHVQTIKGETFVLSAKEKLLIHYDGEPKWLNANEIVVKIDDKKLKVIV
jgi:diacylglycerol kinase (ATP)